ncbi:KICSTOR complex protein kaptin [Lingula anatina]|uniref:KICSTOR complex protein kaptin n=1 Tax=Lingula anatina TaxID=7574 RepID=A0A1S3JBV1_LINAN|nr:KICSTOR complex protein kaptin [Lingula anatina]|eukprot:XP_013407661.1 KICSTOR complex protein kaptin [Lingula anatina]
MSLSSALSEAHFCSLQSQSNVYGLAKFSTPCGRNKLLAASLRGQIICMEYQTVTGKLKPLPREVQFTYIPGDAEIVAIDAFSKTGKDKGVVIAIAFIKCDVDGKPMQYLNIYSDWEPEETFNLDKIAQSCQNVELQFLPFHLCHTDYINPDGRRETVFLLSGNDNHVHLFRELKNSDTFYQQPTNETFPEFMNINSSVMWIDIQHFESGHKRITGFCCQNGYVQVVTVKTMTKEILSCWSTQHDGLTTSLHLFSADTSVECPSFVRTENEGEEVKKKPNFNLVVTSALELTVNYRNVLERGLVDVKHLPDSERYDSVLCSCVTDIDFDGENEILLGTYGQELLIYKFFPTQTSETQPSVESAGSPRTSPREIFNDGQFKMISRRSYSSPILALDYIDITGDGLYEIAVLTMKGLHILQHSLHTVAFLCQERLKCATSLGTRQDAFDELMTENLDTS